jgi:hypothetical protein
MAYFQQDLTVPKRVPLDIEFPEMGVNYTGATMLMHVRSEPGTTGSPIIALSNASPPSQGLSVRYDSDFVDPEGPLPNGASLIRVMIDEATLEGLPLASDAAKPLELFYDIHVTPVGGIKFVFCGGKFLVYPGVTL